MARVKLIGDVQLEFDVKYGLDKDLVITVYSVSADGMKTFIGQADISSIPDKTLSFIGERIETLVKRKEKGAVGIDGFGKFFEYGNPLKEVSAKELYKAMYQTEVGALIMRAYKWRKPEALEEVLEKKLFPLSKDGMREFVSLVKAKEKAKELGWPISTVKKVEHLI
jgi:hypothetical protein